MHRQRRRHVPGLLPEALRQACPNPGMPAASGDQPGSADTRRLDTGRGESHNSAVTVPSGHSAWPRAWRNCPWWANAAHCASISSSARSRPAATAAAANSTPATLAASSSVWSSGLQCASWCSISARSVRRDDRGDGLHPCPHVPPVWSLGHHLLPDEFVDHGDQEQGIPRGCADAARGPGLPPAGCPRTAGRGRP